MIYLGWVVAAFLLGFLAAYIVRRGKKAPRTLRQRFSSVPTFYGRTLVEIQRLAGNAPYSTSHKTDGRTLRTWRDGNYSITLLFDVCDVCLGVEEERT